MAPYDGYDPYNTDSGLLGDRSDSNDQSGDDNDTDDTRRKVMGIVLGVAVGVALLAPLIAYIVRRRRARAFQPLNRGRNERDARASFEADSAAWNASALTPVSAAYPPSSPSPYGAQPAYDASFPASDNDRLVPPQSPFLPPEPPSPSYSAVVPSGHTAGASAGPPTGDGRALSAVGEEEEDEESAVAGGGGTRNHRRLSLAPESLVGGASVVSTGTAPPPYSPKVVGVGADLGRR